MKLIIDIPEELKQKIDEGFTNQVITNKLWDATRNGIPLEPKTGHWIAMDEEPHEDYECDKCGYVCSTFTANIKPNEEYKYCPNCGARMVEPQESEEMKQR